MKLRTWKLARNRPSFLPFQISWIVPAALITYSTMDRTCCINHALEHGPFLLQLPEPVFHVRPWAPTVPWPDEDLYSSRGWFLQRIIEFCSHMRNDSGWSNWMK